MSSVHVTVDDGLGRLVLDRPPLNILTRAMLADISAALEQLAAETALRTLLLTAKGKHFSAGADVGEHMPPYFRDLIPEFLDTVTHFAAFPLPTIAAVQGRCMGGGFELVLGADIVFAAEDAVFGQPEIALGVIPPAACALLPRRCSTSIAAELVYTGDPIGGHDAARAGIVHRVVRATELETVAVEYAHRITRHSAAALRAAKRSLRAAGEQIDGAAMTAAGRIYVEELMASEDAVQGLNAFLEKRQPTWRHR